MDDLAQDSESGPKPKTTLKHSAQELAGRRPTIAQLKKALARIAELEREVAKTQSAHTIPPESKTKAAAYTVAQAAELLNMSVSGVYIAVNRKQIPAIKVGAKILIPKAFLDRLLAIEE